MSVARQRKHPIERYLRGMRSIRAAIASTENHSTSLGMPAGRKKYVQREASPVFVSQGSSTPSSLTERVTTGRSVIALSPESGAADELSAFSSMPARRVYFHAVRSTAPLSSIRKITSASARWSANRLSVKLDAIATICGLNAPRAMRFKSSPTITCRHNHCRETISCYPVLPKQSAADCHRCIFVKCREDIVDNEHFPIQVE